MKVHDVLRADKKVVKIKVKLIADKFSGTVFITDLMLQGGTLSTEWSGHPSEIKWVI